MTGFERMALRLFGARVPDALKAAAILGLVIVLMYGDIVFLGYTINPGLWNYGVLAVPQYGYKGRWLYHAVVMDPLATGGQNWPMYAIIGRMLASGQLPLWNPFQGVGAPLAADTTWDAYFPVNILYAISNQYWDFVWLLKLWLAGFLCYLFFRDLKLSFLPSLGGGFAYCLSGAFIFHPLMPWTDVAILTPALLLCVKRSFDRPLNAGSLSIGSLVIATSILGAHIEALIIQFIFVVLFVLFEAIFNRRMERVRGTITWLATVLLGFGISAFFLVPVLEYLLQSELGHSGNVGVASLLTEGNPMIWVLTIFVPYFFGFLQTYPYYNLRQVFFWDLSPGYVGTSVFFLASLALFTHKSNSKRKNETYIFFFISASLLILLKIFGVPPINWIGYLPVLSHVIFPRYSGSVLAMSFSGACAIGLDNMLRHTAIIRVLRKAMLPPLLIIAISTLTTVPFPASPSNLYFVVSIAYLMLSLFFLFLCYVVLSSGRSNSAEILVFLVILELVCYLPRSLLIGYEAARVAIIAGAALVIVFNSYESRLSKVFDLVKQLPLSQKLPRKYAFAFVLVAALLTQSVVAGLSPMGLPNRYDAFTEAPYVGFLKKNLDDQRVYSLDGLLFPTVAGLFSIQNLGEFSAFMPSSFRTFSLTNLDSGAVAATFVGNAYSRKILPSVTTEIRENMAFYSLLGVKYFATAYTQLNTAHEILLQPEIEGNHSWAPLGKDSVSTQFITNTAFSAVLVRIGTYNRVNTGDVVLMLDSIPYNASFHRETRIRAESIRNGAHNMFDFSEVKITANTEFKATLFQSDTRQGNEVAIMYWPKVKHDPSLMIAAGFPNVALGVALRDESLPIAFHDQNARIYENTRAFPRAFLVSNAIVTRNQEEAVLKTRELGWSTRDTLILEEEPSTEKPASIHLSKEVTLPSGAEIVWYSENEVAIWANVSVPRFLVLTDVYYPGWKCYIDGKPEKIYRAYGAVRAVFVTQGVHEIIFRYEPESFRYGAIISAISIVITLYLFIRYRAVKLQGWPSHGNRT